MATNYPQTTIEQLRLGRDRVAANFRKGWPKNGRVCAVAALHPEGSALGPCPAEEILREVLPSPWTSVMWFNDHRTTTKRDILALYDRAIDRCEGTEIYCPKCGLHRDIDCSCCDIDELA
jgi:hypothetical protein